ncbi:MAG: grasp-with-spasm system SPASM domain peptide maturase [Bacteroidales bacterium]|nr:grasp-with-spasm system SPASM domain peptide maturase [Bacteroidales bacterium]
MIYFSLYTCCFLTKGFSKGCLIDVERNLHCSIPLELCAILENNEISEDSDFKQYIDFLKNEGFVYFTEKKITKQIQHNQVFSPFIFENLIFDFSNVSDFFDRINNINPFEIETMQLRFYCKLDVDQIYSIINQVIKNNFSSVELFFNHSKNNLSSDYVKVYNAYECITKIVIFDYKLKKYLQKENVYYVEEKLISENQCGKISEKFFCPNLRNYLTSLSFNSCLYKKISIDKNGNIKNCPSMKESYGNIKNTALQDALNSPNFTKFWDITKKEISVCQDCEFRNICTDCRCFLTEEDNLFSKPKNCTYNPYSTEWES